MANYKEDGPGASTSEKFTSHPRTHAELVAGFRAYLKYQEPIDRKLNLSPEESIRVALFQQWDKAPLNSSKEAFFEPLYFAWDLLIYDRLKPGSLTERAAARDIAYAYWKDPTIRLTDTQARMLDAMTEAVGIPHQRGRNEIPIPDKYGDFDRWTSSPEYRERLAKQAASERR